MQNLPPPHTRKSKATLPQRLSRAHFHYSWFVGSFTTLSFLYRKVVPFFVRPSLPRLAIHSGATHHIIQNSSFNYVFTKGTERDSPQIIISKNLTDCMEIRTPGAKRPKENFASTGRPAAPLLLDLGKTSDRLWAACCTSTMGPR